MEEIFDQMNNEVDKNTVDEAMCLKLKKEKSSLQINENLIVNCLSTQLLYDVEKSRCLDLEADMSKVHDESKHISKLERECLTLQLKANILKGSRGTNLYTISIDEMMKSSPICLLSKASKSKSWLWHRRLNHLNFGTINDLARKDLVRGLPRLKFEKDHLCSACQLGKSKKFSHRPKSENTNMEVLHTLHMDLCGPMRVQSIKGKKYILVIVDDYSRFTWVKFLRLKDETPEFVTNFLKQIQVGLNKTVRFIRTDNGTEFVNQVMSEYYEGVGIFHQTSVPRTPQQNGVVERRNRTLVEAARTMMIFSKAPMFLWVEAVATACYTHNRSLIHTRHNKTPYELVHDKKPDLTFFRVFGALCYPTNDSEDLGKFQAKADIGIFVGYAPSRKGYRIYNKRTRRLMETIHVTFDEMHQSMAPARMSSGPEPLIMTPGQLKSGLAPTDKELEMLFQPMFDEHLEQSRVNEPVSSATEINAQVVPPGTSLSTTIAQDAPSTSASSSTSDIHLPVQHQEIAEEPIHEDTPIIHDALHPSHNLVTGDPGSAQSSSGNVNSQDHLRRWTKDHPLDNIVGNPSRPVKPPHQSNNPNDEDQQETIPHEEGNDPDLELAMKLSLETPQEKGEGEGDDADLERAIKLSLDPALLPQGRAPVGGVTIREPGSEATPKLHEVVGKGKAVVTEEQVAHSLVNLSKKKRTTDQFVFARRDQTPPDSTTGPSSQPEDDTSEKVVHESSSTSDSERTESDTESGAPKGDKVQGEIVSSTVTSGVSIPVSDPEKAHEAQAGPDPEPMQEDQTGSDSGKLHVSLAGPNPEHMDDEFIATAYPKVHENLKLITGERVLNDKPESHSGSMSSLKNLDDTVNFGDQFLHDQPTEDDQEKSKAREESDSNIPDRSHQTVTSTPPVIAPFTAVTSSEPSLLVTPPPINTEATTITTSLPEITPFIALQLRVARLEQEMSEVKKGRIHFVLKRHTAGLIEKYFVFPGPESVKNQESKKSPKEIIRAKKEQDEEKQDSTYSIRSTDKVDLEEFDLKSALFNHMNKKKSANKNTTNYRLYHALMQALIADEDAMDKEVADKVKDHKRKHDSDDDEDDDDDDEGPSAGSNQVGQKERDLILPLLGQLNLLRKMMIKVQRSQGSLMHLLPNNIQLSPQQDGRSLTQEMLDEGNDSDMGDTDNAHIPKVSTTTWFKPIPESERPAIPEPEWTIPPNDFPELEHD
ncbi:retrovirus-related pol polyprotein from transposon TNT 1-94 [Tanacetum coccineum]